MTNAYEKTDELRKSFDRLAEKFFPNLSSPELVRAGRELEQRLK